MKIFYIIIQLAIGACVIGFFAFMIGYSINKSDRVECLKWQAQADAFPGFYLTQYEKDQCDYQHVEINAPIK